MPAPEYAGLLRTRAGHLLAQVPAGADYPRSLAAATQLTADRLATDDPAAAELASLCAFLAPEPIPDDLFTAAAGQLPGGPGGTGRLIHWPGGRPWPTWPANRWPGSTTAG